MLLELTIKDFAIIDRLHIEFHPGFNVLTGETGAGKSIIIDAVELLLGKRADSSAVRSGADRAIVEGVFRLEPHLRTAIARKLEEHGLEGDDPELLILGREIRRDGRSIGRVNGRAVSLSLLREIADGLVDIHGHTDHLSLIRVSRHLELLDRYAGLEDLRGELAEAVRRLNEVRRDIAELMRDEREIARRIDLLRFQIEEIRGANLRPGEEEELEEERNRLLNAARLAELANEAYLRIRGAEIDSPGGADLIGEALKALAKMAEIDPSTEAIKKRLEEVYYELEDIAEELSSYRGRVEFNPARLEQVEERLELIRGLKRKYGETVEEVLCYAQRAEEELGRISNREERAEELRKKEEELLRRIGELAGELSIRRQRAAVKLAGEIEGELAELRMKNARFAVSFGWRADPNGCPVETGGGDESCIPPSPSRPQILATSEGVRVVREAKGASERLAFDSTGIDRVEFLVATNVGEGFKPLVKIASRGEMSRIMLALKTALARADEVPTLIFDEIDEGIGGRVGAVVGEKLWGLTQPAPEGGLKHQVLCVTHLPQLAGFADLHIKVEKRTRSGRTVASAKALEGEKRLEELAQMLGGKAHIDGARRILEQAEKIKEVSRPSCRSR